MYTVSVRYASSAAIRLAISMNGAVIDTIQGTSTGGSLVNSATVEVPVYLGLNAVRVRCLGGGMTLRSVTFAYVGPITTGVPGVTMGRLDRRAAAPALTAANGCLRLRAGEGVAYRLCDLRGRTVTRGAADAGPGNGAVLSVGRVGSGVYVVRTAGGSAAAALTR